MSTLTANHTQNTNVVHVDNTSEVVNTLNSNPALFVETAYMFDNFLVFINSNNKLAVRTSKTHRYRVESNINGNEITEKDIENILYDVSSMM